MRTSMIPDSDYRNRIARLQTALEEADIDVLITYSSESESASSRYLADFWPFFDFAGIVVPRQGEPALVTGGPESYEFAKQFSRIKDIRIHPAFVESSAPDWVPPVTYEDFQSILSSVCKQTPARIGVTDWNIFPYLILEDLKDAAPNAEIIPADDLLLGVRAIKSAFELAVIRKVYWITEQAMIDAMTTACEGMPEWQIEANAHITMKRLGAEGTPYPIWVCSGPNTRQSLCRSTDRRIRRNELVQLTFGAKYMGYCGNMCRPFAIGAAPPRALELMTVALEGVNGALRDIRPGVAAKEVFQNYHDTLSRYGFEEFTLYGPAHGTGTSEVEGLWLGAGSETVIQPNMQFNIDVWLSDGEYGMRYEDGIIVTEDGIEELTSYRREIIEL
ncbi:MAG: Xaa-Pro peptidase family protein [Chloroflexota bacterium]|nr:Xaa-Pro peptidase family protein [Chloroflexota bacterium]